MTGEQDGIALTDELSLGRNYSPFASSRVDLLIEVTLFSWFPVVNAGGSEAGAVPYAYD